MIKVKSLFKSTYLYLLDFIAPFEAWLATFLIPRGWVSHLAKDELYKRSPKPTFSNLLQQDVFTIGLSENSFTAILSNTIFVFGPTIIWSVLSLLSSHSSNGRYNAINLQLQTILQNGWQILASIIGITFVVVVFVLQYANERKYDGLAVPLFLVETWIIPSVSMGLLTILCFGFVFFAVATGVLSGYFLLLVNSWCLFLFFINTFLAVYVFVKSIQIITPNYFLEKFSVFIKWRIADFVGAELEERYSELIGLDKNQSLEMETPYFHSEPSDGLRKVALKNLSRQIMVVTDTNHYMLQVAAARGKMLMPEYKDNDIVFFGRKGYRVGRERPEIGFVSPALDRPLITEYIRRSVKCIPLRKVLKRTLADEIILNGKLIKDAIEAHDTNLVNELLDHYLDVVEAFLEAIQDYGESYSFDAANRENRVFADWAILSRIENQYRDLIDLVLTCDDNNILRLFLAFPFHVQGLAIRYQDHLVFRRISELIPSVYRRSMLLCDTSKHSFLVDFYLDQLLWMQTYHLGSAWQHANHEKRINWLFEYLVQFFVIWHQLLKTVMDGKAFQQFEALCRAARGRVSFLSEIDDVYLDQLELEIKIAQDSAAVSTLQSKLEEARQLAKLSNELNEIQSSMFFGVGAWLTHLFDVGKISIDEYFSFIRSVDIEFSTLDELHLAYLVFRTKQRNHLFAWDAWEMNEMPFRPGEGRSSSFLFQSWVLLYYTVRGIQLVTDNQVALPPLNLSYLNLSIRDTVEEQVKYLQGNSIWKELLAKIAPNNLSERIASFILLHQRAIDEQRIRDEVAVQTATLSDELVQDFQKEVCRAWGDAATMRSVIRALDRYREYPDKVSNDKNIEFVLPTPKSQFVKNESGIYFQQGREFGVELAHLEDRYLVEAILPPQMLEHDVSEFSRAILDVLQGMRQEGFEPIILIGRQNLASEFHHSQEFVSRWYMDRASTLYNGAEIFGRFNDAYVFQIYSIPLNTVVILDPHAFGFLTQYRVSDTLDFPIDVNVRQLSESEADEILQNDMSWRTNSVTGETLDDTSAVRRIMQHVWVRIQENCRFEGQNHKAVFRIAFRNVNEVNPW